MYGGIPKPGMGTYPPRVRRDRGVSPTGNSRRARLSPLLAKSGRGGAPRPMGLRLGKRWDESHLLTYYIIKNSDSRLEETGLKKKGKEDRQETISPQRYTGEICPVCNSIF